MDVALKQGGTIMDAKKKEAIMECASFDELLDAE
jgi:hypothetical protein